MLKGCVCVLISQSWSLILVLDLSRADPSRAEPTLQLTLNHAISQLRLNRFQWNLKLKLPTRKETIQNTIKDTSPSQECHNHHQLQPKIYICHWSLIGFLIPSNSSDFNQILNIAPSGHVDHPKHHQGHHPQSGTSQSSSTPARKSTFVFNIW